MFCWVSGGVLGWGAIDGGVLGIWVNVCACWRMWIGLGIEGRDGPYDSRSESLSATPFKTRLHIP